MPKIIRGARNTATAAVPRIAGLRLFNNAWPMSAELVGSAHKIVHISPRVVLDDAIPIDVQFLDGPWGLEAASGQFSGKLQLELAGCRPLRTGR
jgi:hypothetical protein